MVYTILRFIAFLILKFFFGLRMYGSENIPRKGGFILASNHVSNLDPIALGVACTRKLNYMAKQELFRHPFSAWFMSLIDVFAVKRSSVDPSALKEAIKRLKAGKGLLLFPEGRRQSLAETESRPQEGVGFFAQKLSMPVIPAFVKGTEKAMPKGAKNIAPVKISVYFGRQVQVKENMSYHEIAQLVMGQIRDIEKKSQ